LEDLGPTDSEEGRLIIGDILSPYGYLYTQETGEKFWRNIDQYISLRYNARTASVKSQRRASKIPLANDQNYKRMRDDDCNGDDVCEAFGDGQCLKRTRRRIPAPDERKRQRHNNEVDNERCHLPFAGSLSD
jgi:hypothetical protein